MQQGPPKSASTGGQRSSALRQFSAFNIFRNIGVSVTFAGEALMSRLTAVCQQQAQDESNQLMAAASEDQDSAAGELSQNVAC